MSARRARAIGLLLAALALLSGDASASTRGQSASCAHVVVFTLPGVTWSDIERVRPPALLAMARDGAVGSVAVRTLSARTTYASGFATIGGGARVDGGRTSGGPDSDSDPQGSGLLQQDVGVAGLSEMKQLAEAADYGAHPGALASALGDLPLVAVGNGDTGDPPPAPAGYGRWALLGAMDERGVVDHAATGGGLLRREEGAPFGVKSDPERMRGAVEESLALACSTVIVEQGDLTRADMASVAAPDETGEDRDAALLAADDLLDVVRQSLDPERDLLLVVSPTSPAWEEAAHLGVAMAAGPGWRGASLRSASTRRSGIVTLPDVAPTVLAHLGLERPPWMNGRPWFGVEAGSDRIGAAIELDREAVFVDGIKSPVSTTFVVFQVLLYVAAIAVLARQERSPGPVGLGLALEVAALAVVAFPLATYLAGAVRAHELGTIGFLFLLLAIDCVLVTASFTLARESLPRLLLLAGATTAVLMLDLVMSARLQLNTVFGYSPIVAGRFAGAGNISFAVLGVTAVVTGALLVHGWRNRAAMAIVAVLFVVVIAVDGAPQFGSDVGGVLALVPALGVTWLLLAGRKPGIKVLVASGLVAIAFLGAFLALDLARPPEARTHLARLWLDITQRGGGALFDTVRRKVEANLRVFRSTIYTLFVPPALGVLAWLLLRPQGRWQRLARDYPRPRAGLIGGLVLAILGFAVNDSGIVIPAVILSYLVPLALVVHLTLDRQGDP